MIWCAWRDSNPHTSRRQDLNLLRLPIPPHAHSRADVIATRTVSIGATGARTHMAESSHSQPVKVVLQFLQDHTYELGAALLFALTAVAAFVSPGGAWPLALGGAACLLVPHAEKFSEISAGASGFKATLRETKSTLAELEDAIGLIAELQLQLIQQEGRWGTTDDDRKAGYLDRTVRMLKSAGVDEERISQIVRDVWGRYERFDYVIAITGNSRVPKNDDKALKARWDAARKLEHPATPEELRSLVKDYGDANALRRSLLDAYEFYCREGRHQDFQLWKRRREVPEIGVY